MTQARISYLLSEDGRKDSLRNGGDGKRQQLQFGELTSPQDLDCFDVDDEGQVSFDATWAPHGIEEGGLYSVQTITNDGRLSVFWNVIPAWEDLLQFVRQSYLTQQQNYNEQYLEWQEAEAAKQSAAAAFLADPEARADKITDGGVAIQGHVFVASEESEASVVAEARARNQRDSEALKKANREALADWTRKFGSVNQQQRLEAGLLPWKEVYEAAQEHLYHPLGSFPLYERFVAENICKCRRDLDEPACAVKFQSVDAVELTADEWDQLAKIRYAVPHATFQLREHRAQCISEFDPQIRRGVIVKLALGSLTFKREFALTGCAQ